MHLQLIRQAQKRPGAVEIQSFSVLAAYEAIVATLNSTGVPSTGRIYFVDGPGGTGNTYLFNYLLHKVIFEVG